METPFTSYFTYRQLWKIIFTIVTLFYLSQSTTPAFAQRQEDKFFYSKFGPNAYVGYLSYVPKDYAANPEKKYPLVLFLHGAGEKNYMATDKSYLGRVTTHGPPKLIRDGKEFPFIVISPQCPFEDWENVTTDNYATSVYRPGEFVDEILEKVKSEYRVDLNRIYITGLSMGAAAIWSYIMRHPEKIAAAVPISGWIDDPELVCNIASNNIPVRTFRGDRDPKTAGTTAFIKSINSCEPAPNPLAEVTVYPWAEHDAWTRTYNNFEPDNIYDWMMSFSKDRTITSLDKDNVSRVEGFSIYPLPALNSITINYTSETSENIQVRVSNQASNMVLQKNQLVKSGQNTFNLDLTELTNGLYYLTLSDAKKTKSQKLVIAR